MTKKSTDKLRIRGFEISKEYVQITRDRVEKVVPISKKEVTIEDYF